MPTTHITLLPGYEKPVQARLVERVSDAVRSVIPAPEVGTITFIAEASTYMRDGRVLTQGNANLVDAAVLVRTFLGAMQARELDQAKAFLAPDFVMRFPGNAVFHQLEELVKWGQKRYQNVSKFIESIEQSWQRDCTVVYCYGTLSGKWPDGTHFAGIRFIDRFKVVNNLLVEQDVWNDIAEVRSTF
jgi:phenylpyruvate tautomerase PptA (4-oxalocrotonate tautomerase family)